MEQLYFSHRARSCHSFSWKMSAYRSLKFWQLTRPCKWVQACQGWGIILSEGGNSFHSQKLACILKDWDVQRDTQQEAPVCELKVMLFVPGRKKTLSHFWPPYFSVFIWGLTAPQGTRIQQGNGRTMNWKMALMLLSDCVCFFKTVSAPSHVGTSLSAAQNYQKSLLMIVFKKCHSFLSLFCVSPSLFSIFLGHTLPKDVILVVLHVFS